MTNFGARRKNSIQRFCAASSCSETYILFILGQLNVEIAERCQYYPNGKLYRIPDRKGIRMTMDQFNLFVFHSVAKLVGEWQQSGENTHVFGDFYARWCHSGVSFRKYYIQNGEILPGVPKLFFTHEQWRALMHNLPLTQAKAIEADATTLSHPCFCNMATHYEEDIFIGCPVCLPFIE